MLCLHILPSKSIFVIRKLMLKLWGLLYLVFNSSCAMHAGKNCSKGCLSCRMLIILTNVKATKVTTLLRENINHMSRLDRNTISSYTRYACPSIL